MTHRTDPHASAAPQGQARDAAAPGMTGAAPARRTGGLLSGVDWTRPRPRHEVTLLTKPGCHLCDDARGVVAAVCQETGSAMRERDITGDPALTRDYAEFVPVVFVDGAPWDRWRIDAARLRSVLD
ncbi:glutaredoxin family protein [Kocuria sp.]|uniref:glutaredoxin family protein n=1 Tax=Kocuria sp. TaxID=1871328 RepID=UPI0026DA7507|nr:glutaredoxin family protein [Kocuria sp.]MDO4918320.1 glutaredoxin family protein [Kocuria sp.]